ncbi:hypothetical protein PAXRUDRAFT_36329 [Paxillus rubicundulus Ve08.2h10]|uniref:Uncharacterized protein n=1 Tax=Paxillus rubicundulus Ve08.2h10 TaxID=930991 RepID=A0A0D0DFS0_9AGAM|nr:hypothetical protein PAXRUDRAFT_36329 [Paxillus rubicundulus Ve08.2h10]
MTTETAKTISLFCGDYSDKEEPADWFALLQLTLSESWMDDQMVRCFSKYMAPNSLAEEWFDGLLSSDKYDMGMLQKAFPQQRECIKGITIREEDIRTWIQKLEEHTGDYGQNIWAEQVMRLAQSMGDIHSTLIEHAIEGAPRLLQDQLTEGYNSWEDFLEGVRAIRKETLDIEHDDAVANLQQQMIQMSL